ncbi:TetR/AcrR family transcriptional regulator [Cellulomonas triticagri]|uniref:TetR/AcrR family transcriptional regulator n=1 Tax=Cellulomonas triticagri TaxID=2483352 RepID=UPI0013159702|nr:TetR/AcrR family transcriptional regulator [Cellulomonas triticagri]
MTLPSPVTDRRAALKARSRQAILAAADALLRERGDAQFSVDELAARADVARRTVFNHFDSLDDVVLSTCTARLNEVIHEVQTVASTTPVGDGSRSAMFDELALTLRGADLPEAITYLAGALGPLAEGNDPRAVVLAQEAFSRVADHLSGELVRRYPVADALDVQLLVSSLVHGVAVIALHWCTTTDPAAPDARAAWDSLVDRLIDSVRAGYMPER